MHGDGPWRVVRTSFPLTALNDALSQVRNRVLLAALVRSIVYASSAWHSRA